MTAWHLCNVSISWITWLKYICDFSNLSFSSCALFIKENMSSLSFSRWFVSKVCLSLFTRGGSDSTGRNLGAQNSLEWWLLLNSQGLEKGRGICLQEGSHGHEWTSCRKPTLSFAFMREQDLCDAAGVSVPGGQPQDPPKSGIDTPPQVQQSPSRKTFQDRCGKLLSYLSGSVLSILKNQSGSYSQICLCFSLNKNVKVKEFDELPKTLT